MRFADVVVAVGARAGAEVVPARGQMATTLGFHIILACLGIAFPTIVLLAEFVGLRHSNAVALTLARRWSQAMGVLVAVGAVTGTVLSFEMGLLWPGLMRQYGAVLGLPFGVEGLFFFLEAIFTAIYLYGWRRLPGWAHFWTGVPIAVSGIFGAMSVIAVNSWMNTGRQVPEWLGGVYINGHIYGGLRIPYMDSLLVGFGSGTKVTGWDSVPAADRPPVVWLIHLCFDAMVGLGFLLLLAGLWALYEWWRHRRLPRQRLFWVLGAVSGLAAITAMECGWVVTEVGRQPWVVYKLLTTTAAATTNGGVIASLTFVIVLYAVLGAATIGILRILARRWRRGGPEPEVPYGPPPALQEQSLGGAES